MKRVHVKRLVRIDGKHGLILSNGDVLENVVAVELSQDRDEVVDLSIKLLVDKNSIEIADSIRDPEIFDS